MPLRKKQRLAATGCAVVTLAANFIPAHAQAPAAPAADPPAATAPAASKQPSVVVRRVVMKDALSAEQFKARLEAMKANNLFRDTIAGPDPKKPVVIDIAFLVSGNYLLVTGSKDWVDANIESIRLMAYLFERPRAYLQLNLRVVQLTGPANADVIQMSETVRALVDARREEIVRTFADLDEYLTRRVQLRQGPERELYDTVQQLFPSLGTGVRPLTVPETLLLLMLDRSAPAPHAAKPVDEMMRDDTEEALLTLSRRLGAAVRDPNADDAKVAAEVQQDLDEWKKAVTAIRDWMVHYADVLKKEKGNSGISALREALQLPNSPVPSWLSRRLLRSLELTERLYPSLVRRHTQASLEELGRRYDGVLDRANRIEQALKMGEEIPMEDSKTPPPPGGRLGRNLVALKSLAEELVPAPLALFDSVAIAADNAAPSPEQLVGMLKEYAAERRKLDTQFGDEDAALFANVNYQKLQSLEAGLNLWLRRVSEAMARALEQQFYRRYVDELRLLANKQLGKNSNRDILGTASINEVPDVTRDLLLADSGVNIFVSNSISMQFAPDTSNTVSAQVQSSLPSKQSLLERVQQANQAASALNVLSQNFGIDGTAIVKALMAGGQAVPVQGGVTLSATPSVGFDAGTVTLSLTANQTLAPGTEKVVDRVTNHSINNATVTALSYEPMVLSTLASNISYYEDGGGIPILRKTPIVKDLAKDIPLKPFQTKKRQKGIYQSSVIILEPVVIPTIEDLVRFHGGWREAAPGAPKITVNPD